MSASVFSSRRCLHNVPSSSLCDFAERGPGSGCHPLPPSQHCPWTPDQRHPAAHRLPALPHQPAPHLHRPAVWGAGTRLWKHRALLPGVQRADGPLQRIWVRWVHEEGLCFTGPFWAAGPTAGMWEQLLKKILSCLIIDAVATLIHTTKRCFLLLTFRMHFSLMGQTWAEPWILNWLKNTHIAFYLSYPTVTKDFNKLDCSEIWITNSSQVRVTLFYVNAKQNFYQMARFDSITKTSRKKNYTFLSSVTSSHCVVYLCKTWQKLVIISYSWEKLVLLWKKEIICRKILGLIWYWYQYLWVGSIGLYSA